MPQPFRFAVSALGTAAREEWRALARRAESLGYAALLLPDHMGEMFAPLVALMAAADATTTLRVGSFVFNNDFRHPVVLAKELATLDLLSGGRVEVGLGAGWLATDYSQAGLLFDPPDIRVGRLAESVQIIKGYFGDQPLTFHGEHYAVTGLQGFPRPLQRPHPPILIAGSGRRMLSLAAREASSVGLAVRTHGTDVDLASSRYAATAQQLEWVRQAAPHRFATLEINTIVLCARVTPTRQQTAEQLARVWRVTPDQLLSNVHMLVGSVDQLVDEIQMWRERFHISSLVIYQHDMEAFAPVVARLTGT